MILTVGGRFPTFPTLNAIPFDGPPGVVAVTVRVPFLAVELIVTVVFIWPERELVMLTPIPSGGVKLTVLASDKVEPLMKKFTVEPALADVGDTEVIDGATALWLQPNPMARNAAISARVTHWSGQ